MGDFADRARSAARCPSETECRAKLEWAAWLLEHLVRPVCLPRARVPCSFLPWPAGLSYLVAALNVATVRTVVRPSDVWYAGRDAGRISTAPVTTTVLPSFALASVRLPPGSPLPGGPTFCKDDATIRKNKEFAFLARFQLLSELESPKGGAPWNANSGLCLGPGAHPETLWSRWKWHAIGVPQDQAQPITAVRDYRQESSVPQPLGPNSPWPEIGSWPWVGTAHPKAKAAQAEPAPAARTVW
jgi:hypothetical protein